MGDLVVISLGGSLLFLLGILGVLEFLGDLVSTTKAGVRKVTQGD